MEVFGIGYLAGCISVIAIWIFFNARGEGSSPESLKKRVDRNNISTERGLGSLETNNSESGRIINEAQDTAERGLGSIENTNRTVSELIADAKRNSEKKPKG